MTDHAKTRDLTRRVLDRFGRRQWYTFPEAKLGNRRVDVLALNLWRSKSWAVHGIEVKVSRKDWEKELLNPSKSKELIKFVDAWWVAAPWGMIDPKELPEGWGLLETRDDGGLRVKKQARLPETFKPFDRELAVRFILKTLDQEKGKR